MCRNCAQSLKCLLPVHTTTQSSRTNRQRVDQWPIRNKCWRWWWSSSTANNTVNILFSNSADLLSFLLKKSRGSLSSTFFHLLQLRAAAIGCAPGAIDCALRCLSDHCYRKCTTSITITSTGILFSLPTINKTINRCMVLFVCAAVACAPKGNNKGEKCLFGN